MTFAHRQFQARLKQHLEERSVITSYSIHYTKLYDDKKWAKPEFLYALTLSYEIALLSPAIIVATIEPVSLPNMLIIRDDILSRILSISYNFV